MDYKEMLAKAREELPEAVFTAERFEIPKVMGHIEGNKTIVTNFHQIAQMLHRDVDHIVKFILRELATPGGVRGQQFILGSKMSAARINEKIGKYARSFVLCEDCGKPETKIVKEGQAQFIKCQACGAKHAIKRAV